MSRLRLIVGLATVNLPNSRLTRISGVAFEGGAMQRLSQIRGVAVAIVGPRGPSGATWAAEDW